MRLRAEMSLHVLVQPVVHVVVSPSSAGSLKDHLNSFHYPMEYTVYTVHVCVATCMLWYLRHVMYSIGFY